LAVGQAILVVLILILLYLFIIFLRPEIFEDSIKLTLISLLIILLLGATAFIYNSKLVNVYTIPFCVLPIIIRSFFDTRLALFTYLLTTMLISLVVPYSFEFLFIEILGGISVVFTALNLRQRSRLFLMISTLAIVYCSAFLGLHLVGGGDLTTIDVNMLLALATSAMLTLIAFPLIYLIERIFGYTSDISLLELSDTNSPLLREMALKAPGTFQHSLQVANLAESAIGVIGGNMLLARTGALYHDIGKIEFARYFIENQLTGVNPHNELDFDESAQLIISHVQRGIQLARKYKLPDRIIDFIRTHHGTSTVHHFYKSFLKNYPEEEVDEGAFRYPGPIPYSKETAVVMMADAVEARSRSFNALTKEQIVLLVDDSIQRQLEDNQFVNADITLRDISKIKKVFKKILIDFHHIRIIEG
jgi:putative nucleotidyltransferase with HDIG domain